MPNNSELIYQAISTLVLKPVAGGFELDIKTLDLTLNLDQQFKLAHDFCEFLMVALPRELKHKDIPSYLPKATIRAEVIYKDGQYKVKIPEQYEASYRYVRDQWSDARLWLRSRFFNVNIRWLQHLLSKMFAPTNPDKKYDKSHEAGGKTQEQLLAEAGHPIVIPCNAGNVVTGYEAKPAAPSDHTILFYHGNGTIAANRAVGDAVKTKNDGSYHLRDAIRKGTLNANYVMLDQPGYGLSTGRSRSTRAMENALFDAALHYIHVEKQKKISLYGISLGGISAPRVALRLQKYVAQHPELHDVHIDVVVNRTMRSLFSKLMNGLMQTFITYKKRMLVYGHQNNLAAKRTLRDAWILKDWRIRRLKDSIEQAHKIEELIDTNPQASLNLLQKIIYGTVATLAGLVLQPILFLAGWGFNNIGVIKRLAPGTFTNISAVGDEVMGTLASPAAGIQRKEQRFIGKQETAILRKQNELLGLMDDYKVAPSPEKKTQLQALSNQIIYKKLLVVEHSSQQFAKPHPITSRVQLLPETKAHRTAFQSLSRPDLQQLADQRKERGSHDDALTDLHAISRKSLAITAHQKLLSFFRSVDERASKIHTHKLREEIENRNYRRHGKPNADDHKLLSQYLLAKDQRHRLAAERAEKDYAAQNITALENVYQNDDLKGYLRV